MSRFSDHAIATLKEMAADYRAHRVDKRPMRRKQSAPAAQILAYKATSDESGGTITMKRVNSDGTVTGDEITAKVLP
jgi:hypothetical protein